MDSRIRNCVFLMIFICLSGINNCNAIMDYEILQSIFDKDDNSLKLQSPPLPRNAMDATKISTPVHVQAAAYISKIYEVNEINMEMKSHLHLRMTWSDTRLDEKNLGITWSSDPVLKYIRLTDEYKLWVPDILLPDEKGTRRKITTNDKADVLIFPNGTVMYQVRFPELVTVCPMDLRMFPFDKQTCQLRIFTRTSNMKEVLLFWRSVDPVILNSKVNVLHYNTIYKIDSMMMNYQTTIGEYSALGLNIYFERSFHSYFWKFYVPVLVTVLISWIPFNLNETSVLRNLIAVLTVIFLGWQYLTVSDQLKVSYTTRNDVWRIVNFIFVFAAALESIYVSHSLKTQTTMKYPEREEKSEELDLEVAKVKSNFKLVFVGLPTRIIKLDKLCQLYVPVLYCTFIFVFWLSL